MVKFYQKTKSATIQPLGLFTLFDPQKDLGEAGPFLNETTEESEDISIGILFASKAIVQLLGK